MFYYAGHGIQAEGENYLIPTKTRIPTQQKLKDRAMSANYVLDNMKFARNALNIIVLDACRDNPLPVKSETRSIRPKLVAKNGLAEMDNPAGSILIYSTAPGKQAYDGHGSNGVFTKHLLNGIKEHGHLSIQDMLILVRPNVKQ
ncbi:caspase family protein [Candidatus Marithrix sp. Canyon 246]|uniref:caspase family protein n=1 Tax=Candidatus Marithrix sp. Canyon 246 TaxID=1827136 RepID=UPI000849FCBC|nr:caspase family protein [Candidatus Marithrix sp. Canyon 246]